jgi:hypothetical protein
MKNIHNIKIRYQFIGIIITLFSIGLVINSCEQDQIVPASPIVYDNSCDTNNVSFLQFIKPQMDKNCISCHSGTDGYAGVNLEGYENIKKTAVNGQLLKALYGSMSSFIEDNCTKRKIKAWINQGSKNN